MFITNITDCSDPATMGRSTTRIASLFDAPVIPVGLAEDLAGTRAYLEAAFTLIDILDAAEGREGVVLVNVAPRNGKAKKWPNGTPFGWFKYKYTMVCSSVDGGVLGLINMLGVADEINVWDIPTVMEYVKSENILDSEHADYIKETQFRSFEFLPRVAKWTHDQLDIPTESIAIDGSDISNKVAVIDNFGNIKTTILPDQIDFEAGKEYRLSNKQTIKAYKRLKDVPNGNRALIIGSSGLGNQRFLEVVVQGNSAAQFTGLTVGDSVLKM